MRKPELINRFFRGKRDTLSSITQKALALMLAVAVMMPGAAFPAYALELFQGTEEPWVYLAESSNNRKDIFSAEELLTIGNNLRELNAELAAEGIDFVVFIAPDKEEIYSEYLPADRTLVDEDRIKTLVFFLNTYFPEVPVVYPVEELRERKSRPYENVDVLYCESGSHWNAAGAYAGTEALMKVIGTELGLEYNDPEPVFDYTGKIRTDTSNYEGIRADAECWHSGYKVKEGFSYRAGKSLFSDSNHGVVRATAESTREDAWDKTLYFAGDSFRLLMFDPLASRFSKTTMVNRYFFDAEDLLEQHPDVFVLETVGRYAKQLMTIDGYNTASLPVRDCSEVQKPTHEQLIFGAVP